MSFAPYQLYQQVADEWPGRIPSHWEYRRLKDLVRLLTDKSVTSENRVALENIEGWTGRFIETAAEFEGQGVGFREGDLLFGKLRPYLAKIWLAQFNGEAVGDFHVMRPGNGCFGRFLAFQMLNASFISIVDGSTFGAKMPRASWEFMSKLRLATPPLPEQRTIAAFLNRETAKIDALVAEQRRLIELLQEKRQAVISHAVTKGLNPDVRMKPSGIEWLGDVPEHWEVGPIKHFFISLDGRRIPLSTEERADKQGEYPYYGASGVIDYVDEFLFDEDLVLVSEDGANLLNRSTPIAFVATGKFWVNNHAHILKPADNYLVFWAERIEAVDLFPFVTGSAQPKFTADALMNLRIAVPPDLSERQQIEHYVVNGTKSLSSLIATSEQALTLLQERRTALISAAVTGKIDVRGWANDGERDA